MCTHATSTTGWQKVVNVWKCHLWRLPLFCLLLSGIDTGPRPILPKLFQTRCGVLEKMWSQLGSHGHIRESSRSWKPHSEPSFRKWKTWCEASPLGEHGEKRCLHIIALCQWWKRRFATHFYWKCWWWEWWWKSSCRRWSLAFTTWRPTRVGWQLGWQFRTFHGVAVWVGGCLTPN